MENYDLGWLLGMSKNPVALGFLIFGLVQTVKRQAQRREPPLEKGAWFWRGWAVGFAVVCSALLHLWTGEAVLGAQGWAGVLVFALVAATSAVAGRDGLKTALEWVGLARTTTAPVGASPSLPAGPDDVSEGPPPEAFEQPRRRLSLAAVPSADVDGQPLTHPTFSMRE